MANKERNKRAARKARQAKRQEAEAQQAVQAAATAAPQAEKKLAQTKKAEVKKTAKAAKKTGLMATTKTYFGDVRSELRRVVWPSRADLKSYTVAVIVMLVVFGLAIWLIDTGVVAGLVGFFGLRG